MESIIKSIKSFYNLTSRHFSEADPWSKSLIIMLVILSIVSPSIASAGIAFCVYFFIEHPFISGIIGVILFAIFFIHARALIFNTKDGTIAFILILSFIISAVLMMPVKLQMNIEEQTSMYRRENMNKLKLAERNANLEISKLYERKVELEKNLQKGADSFTENKQGLYDARRLLNEFNTGFEARKKEILSTAISQSGYEENLKISKMTLLKFFVQNSISGDERLTFIIQFFLVFLLEGSIGFILIGLRSTTFMKAVKKDLKTREILLMKRAQAERDSVIDTKNALKHIYMANHYNRLAKTLFDDSPDFSELQLNMEVLQSFESTQQFSTVTKVTTDIPSGQNGTTVENNNSEPPRFKV